MIVIVLKKKWLVALLISSLVLGAFVTVIRLKYHSLETLNIPSTAKVIVIDPGHGGVDPGAVAKDGTLEKDINLAIGLYLREYLEQSGAIVIMTRETDKGLYDNTGTIRAKKNQDLRRRREIVQKYSPNVFITIHLNSFPQQQYYGAQAFFPKGHIEGEKLAKIIQEELIEVLDKENKRMALSKEGIYLIADLNHIPTVLVEGGFLSNQQELAKLKDSNYQQKMAWALYVGIQRYLKESS
ncbi:N-acetylmuramoyl-L-alanine amidase CwlD [Alkaliphilus transvaalensis]|uniref:N-acetylmuramoyl-L-alanine amidase CwlD n=1 Tax=Alkaliphilus transvaalensis TaxID=114628 RepID=UPI00047E66B4|nr:N-acetylmuramoyl-L-alanine amidase CwlD [Alkaliphilus transvaalensis]